MKKVHLLLILSLGLLLRVIGADWGFPLLLHPDEHTIAWVPVEMSERSSLDPGVYMRPDHILIYANAAVFHAASHIRYGRPLKDTFYNHTAFYYLLARIFVALLGTASIVLAYLIGKEYAEGTGSIAALIFAVFPSYVGHSHYITSDIALTLCVLSAVLFAIRYLKDPQNIYLIMLSLSSAIAVSVKYPGVLILLLMVSVVLTRNYADRKKLFTDLFKACIAFLCFTFIISPYLFINFRNVVQSFIFEARSAHYGAEGLGWLGNMLFYAESYLSFSGIMMLLFFPAGVFYAIKNEKKYAVPLFFGLVYWVLLSGVPLHWERWALPMYTFPLLITAYGISAVYGKIRASERKYLGVAFHSVVLLGLFRLLLVAAVVTATFTLKDTRWISYQFIKEAGINEENALYEGYTPLCPNMPHLIEAREDTSKNDKKFVILSSHAHGRFLKEKEKYKAQNQFYNQLFSLDLVKEFVPVLEEDFTDTSFRANDDVLWDISFLITYLKDRARLLTGPRIRIYKLDLC